jgi:ATP-dependent Lon protease
MPFSSKNDSAKGKGKKYNMRSNKKQNLKRNPRKPDSDDEEEVENIMIEMDSEEDDYETCSESDDDEEEDNSDSTYIPPKKKRLNKKKLESSDEEDEDEDDDECDEDEDEDNDEDDDSELHPHELRKTIAALFPSNYINKKVKQDSKMASKKKDTSKKHKSKQKKSSRKSSKKSKHEDTESEDDSDEDDDDEDEDDYDEYDDEDADNDPAKNFSIFFTAMDNGNAEDENAICDDADAEDDCNSDDEKTFMKETYTPILLPSSIQESGDPIEEKSNKKSKNGGKKSKKSDQSSSSKKKKGKHNSSKDAEEDGDSDDVEKIQTEVEAEYNELVELKKHLLDKLAMKPKSKILLHAIEECRISIQKLVKKARMKNAKKYYKLVNREDKPTSEIDYFKKKLSHKEQIRVMKELKEINDRIHIEKPYRLTLLDSNIPAKYKATVMQKLNMLRSMEPGDPEYYKLKTWVDTFMRVPFSVNKNLSISITDGIEKCSEFMENAMNTLDTCVYGLKDAKMQIMQMLGQWITNPDAMGSAIAIKGPPGTGKTSLVKEGISKILGREFSFIALGGTGDASFLEGHSYTYEGSMWGKIVQILIDSKCMNPVIYFDELDKVSDTPRGEEIIGILTHLTDTTQNNQFHDKYFSEVDFDLSKCLFIFSYNDESKVNPILRDRMYRIETKGYDAKEKSIIARNYLLPKIRQQVSFNDGDVIIPEETLEAIIKNEGMTKSEDGVRNLKRCLEIIHTKLNLFRLMKPGQNLFVKEMDMEVQFPFTVRKKDADVLIKSEQHQNQSLLAMYC